MDVDSVKVALLALSCAAALTGCTTQWPADMPAVTYSGAVINGPRHAPEPGATVVALRPKADLSFYPPALFIPYEATNEKLGEVQGARDGSFTLKTTSGYATELVASSRDGWLEAWVGEGLKHDKSNLLITMVPAERDIAYHSVNLSEDDCDGLRTAFGKIVSGYLALDRHALSIDQYTKRGILAPGDNALLEKLKPHLLGEKPDISMVYSRCLVRIDSFAKPVRFERNPNKSMAKPFLDISP